MIHYPAVLSSSSWMNPDRLCPLQIAVCWDVPALYRRPALFIALHARCLMSTQLPQHTRSMRCHPKPTSIMVPAFRANILTEILIFKRKLPHFNHLKFHSVNALDSTRNYVYRPRLKSNLSGGRLIVMIFQRFLLIWCSAYTFVHQRTTHSMYFLSRISFLKAWFCGVSGMWNQSCRAAAGVSLYCLSSFTAFTLARWLRGHAVAHL